MQLPSTSSSSSAETQRFLESIAAKCNQIIKEGKRDITADDIKESWSDSQQQPQQEEIPNIDIPKTLDSSAMDMDQPIISIIPVPSSSSSSSESESKSAMEPDKTIPAEAYPIAFPSTPILVATTRAAKVPPMTPPNTRTHSQSITNVDLSQDTSSKEYTEDGINVEPQESFRTVKHLKDTKEWNYYIHWLQSTSNYSCLITLTTI